MTTVESVLNRSRVLDDPPYDAILEFEGFQVGLRVYGKLYYPTHSTALRTDLNSYDPLLADENIPTSTASRDDGHVSSLVSNSGTIKPAEKIPEIFHPNVDAEPYLFFYEGNQYVVEPYVQVIYEVLLGNGMVTELAKSRLVETPSIDIEYGPITGTLQQQGDDMVFVEESSTDKSGLFSFLQGDDESTGRKFPLEFDGLRNKYEFSELDISTVLYGGTTQDSSYACDLVIENDALVVQVSDIGAEWQFPLDDFGRLDNRVSTRLDLDSLYVTVDRGDTAFITVAPSTNENTTMEELFLSDCGDWVIESCK